MTASDLHEQITVELASLDIVEATLLELVEQRANRVLTPIERAAVFSLLIQLYGGFERLFENSIFCHFFPHPALRATLSQALRWARVLEMALILASSPSGRGSHRYDGR
jgi:hypothetical protein